MYRATPERLDARVTLRPLGRLIRRIANRKGTDHGVHTDHRVPHSRYDELTALEDEWEQATEGKRTLRRSIITRDRNDPNRHLVIAFFDSYDSAMVNSNLPETGEFGRSRPHCSTGQWCSPTSTSSTTVPDTQRSVTPLVGNGTAPHKIHEGE